MARLGAGIGMNLLGWTRAATADLAQYGLRLVALEELFAGADVVTLHLALCPQTERIISRALLEMMKPAAYFINTSRAKLVDNQALADTPHIAYDSKEAGVNMLRIAYVTFDAFL